MRRHLFDFAVISTAEKYLNGRTDCGDRKNYLSNRSPVGLEGKASKSIPDRNRIWVRVS